MIRALTPFMLLSLGTLLGLLPISLSAAAVTHAEVVRKGKVFYLDSTLELNAPRELMFELLTDYDRMQDFSEGFVESKHYPANAKGEVKIYLHLKGCVAFFCRHVKKMETLEISGFETIKTTLIPEESHNVKRFANRWEFSDINIPIIDGKIFPSDYAVSEAGVVQLVYAKGTKIRYRMVFQPDFWVPPVIGDYLVKKALVSNGTEILERMEKTAQRMSKVE